jgi:hypothetical protein
MARRKTDLHFSRPFPFSPLSSSPPPCPHGPRASHGHSKPHEHAGNAVRAGSTSHRLASARLAQLFFFFLFPLSLSLSAKNRNSPIQTFSSLPRLAHRRRRCSTLLSSPPPPPPPPPPRQVKHRVVWPPLDRESRPRSLDDASRPPRPRFGRCRGSVSGVRVRVAGR